MAEVAGNRQHGSTKAGAEGDDVADVGGIRRAARRTGRRPDRLSRALIVQAAVAFVDANGLADLTMRRLGSVLQVQAMSLYAHVPSREDLLDGMVEAVVDELYGDPEVHTEPRAGWEDYLQRLAYGVRRIAFGHPKLFPLVATRPPAAPWVRPPLRSLRLMNSFLDGLTKSGFSDENAAVVYRAFTSFLLGHLLLDVAAMNVDTSAVADPGVGSPAGADAPEPADPLADYAVLQRMQQYLSEDLSGAEFEQSLGNLLTRLDDFRTTS